MNQQDKVCAEVTNNLPWYVGGDLEADALASIDRHLAECAACAAQAMRSRDARQAFATDLRARETRGPNLWPGVRAALARDGLLQPMSPQSPTIPSAPIAAIPRARPTRRYWVAGTAAAAAILVGFWLGRDFLDTESAVDAPPIAAPHVRPVTGSLAGNFPAHSASIPVTPVADASGLRRIGGSEVPLRENADIFLDAQPPWNQGPQFAPPNAGSPASLRQVRRGQ